MLTVLDNDNDPEGWIYIIINSGNGTTSMVGGTHPIHLHGHDFAIISQGPGLFDPNNAPTSDIPNPPRRDVAMLPSNGHLVIAMKNDNPGVWVMHCHIAWHAGSGLAMQVVESRNKIVDALGGSGALDQTRQGCSKWSDWLQRPGSWKYEWQEDSGI